MMKSALYSARLILATCISLSLSSQEHNRQSPVKCQFVKQEHRLTCSSLTLSVAPISPHAELVKMLDLSPNNITELNPKFFDGYSSVVTLIMTNAKIQQIYPDAFHSLKDLQTVDLSYNFFAVVPPELFTENPKLENVSLSNNPLSMQTPYLPILKSPSLLHLNLRNCKLSNLSSDSLSKLPNMLSLDLSGNRFKELRIDAVFSHLRLIDINLTGNPWICNNVFEKLVCWAYRESQRRRSIRCTMKNSTEKSYGLKDQHELCDKLSVTISSVTSITSTPKEPVDVTTDMTIRTLETVSQSTSQEYTTTVPQEDTRERSSESHDAFDIRTTTQPPRPYDNEGPENSKTRSLFLCVFFVLPMSAVVLLMWRVVKYMVPRRQPQQEIQEDEHPAASLLGGQPTARVTVQHPGHVNRGSDSDIP